MENIVIVGASITGLMAAETLRRHGFGGTVTMVGDERRPPYDRPPLSKHVLDGRWEPERAALRNRGALDELDLDWVLGVAARELDVRNRSVMLSDGRVIGYHGLIIATGVSPKRLPFGHDLYGLHVLRTLDDALSLRDGLREGGKVVIIGAGFLGAEIAAVAVHMGLEVSLVEALPVPMMRQLGAEMGALVAKLHAGHGVRLYTGTGVADITGEDDRVRAVRLTSGETLAADLVVVAIGSSPNTEWLAGSGLRVGNGVECDELCRAAPGVVAAGDVANWHHPGLGRRLRVEHKMNATEQGRAAALTLLGHGEPFAPIPFFWTDQYDVKIQAYGMCEDGARTEIIAGDPGARRFAAVYVDADGRTVGALSWNMPREARALRQRVADAL